MPLANGYFFSLWISSIVTLAATLKSLSVSPNEETAIEGSSRTLPSIAAATVPE